MGIASPVEIESPHPLKVRIHDLLQSQKKPSKIITANFSVKSCRRSLISDHMSYGTEEEKKCVAKYELEDLKTAGLLKKFQPVQVSNANVHVHVSVR